MTAQHNTLEDSSEEDSLLPRLPRPASSSSAMFSKRFKFSWAAHPFWLIPVVLVMSMSRGFTMSPRIQVYKAIACRNIVGDTSDLSLSQLLVTSADCNSSEVTARAAKIQAAVVTTMSALSAISTGFWSRLGDTNGRKLILCTFLLGALLMEAVFVLVMKPNTFFGRHAEKLILVGPIVEGFVGGLSTFNGVVHAYISDCTRHGSRSTIFSTVQGMVFVGLASGPWVTGLILPHKGYDDRFFYGSIGLITTTILYVIFVCPESLQSSAHTARTPRRSASRSGSGSGPLMSDGFSPSRWSSNLYRYVLKFISAVLLPISMFRPRPIPGTRRKNYNLMLCGLALFIYLVSTGVYSAKYIYAEYVFKWSTAQLGYYMSVLWICRAINLLVFLPIVLSYLKPKSTTQSSNPTPEKIAREIRFDQRLAQISLFVDGFADTLVAITQSNSQGVYYVLSCMSSFTSGGNPALHSLGAVCMHACGETADVGAFFGAIGVISAIAHIMSPSIYARTYKYTVAWYPEGIFVVGAVLLFSSVFLLSGMSSDDEDIAVSMVQTTPHSQRRSSGGYEYQAVPTAVSTTNDSEDQNADANTSGK